MLENRLIIANTCVDLNVFFQFAKKNLAMLEAYHEMQEIIDDCDIVVRNFINDSILFLEQQLLLEVSRIYDSEKTGSFENITMNRLCTMLKDEFDINDPVAGKVIEDIEELCNHYSKADLKNMRNKTFAHHDKDTLDEGKEKTVSFSLIKELVLEGGAINSLVGSELLSLGLPYNDYDNMVQEYKKAIQIMIKR